jgi:hypothetical protein
VFRSTLIPFVRLLALEFCRRCGDRLVGCRTILVLRSALLRRCLQLCWGSPIYIVGRTPTLSGAPTLSEAPTHSGAPTLYRIFVFFDTIHLCTGVWVRNLLCVCIRGSASLVRVISWPLPNCRCPIALWFPYTSDPWGPYTVDSRHVRAQLLPNYPLASIYQLIFGLHTQLRLATCVPTFSASSENEYSLPVS